MNQEKEMNDKELADKVVALGIGKPRLGMVGYMFEGYGMSASEFVRDWRVFGALLEKDIEDNGYPPKGDWPHDVREGIETLVEILNA